MIRMSEKLVTIDRNYEKKKINENERKSIKNLIKTSNKCKKFIKNLKKRLLKICCENRRKQSKKFFNTNKK